MTGFHGNKLVSHVIHTKKSLEVLRIEDREGFSEFPTICRRASRLSYLTGSVALIGERLFHVIPIKVALAGGTKMPIGVSISLFQRGPREGKEAGIGESLSKVEGKAAVLAPV